MKRKVLIISALLAMFGFRFLPALAGMSASMMQVLGIFIGALILWLGISIDWPSVLLICALALVPEFKMSSILSGSYGNSTVVFLIFTFVVSHALTSTSYIRRIAMFFMESRFSKKGPWSFIALYFASIIFIGCFISPTVLFFVYLPILEEIYRILDLKKGDKLASILMMGTVIMCGISSGMTPIAHVFATTAMGLYANTYGESISYLSYMAVAIPVGILTAILTTLCFRFFIKADLSPLENRKRIELSGVEGEVSGKEKVILAIFIMVVILWVVPGLMTLLIKEGPVNVFFKKIDSFGIAFPPMLATVLLCIIEIDKQPLIRLPEAMKNGVSWPSIVMCAATLALGSALKDIGLTTYLSDSLAPLISGLAPIVMVLIFTLWAAVQTNLSSNLVTANVVSIAALAITASLSNVSVAGIIINIGMMASYSFATPPAMPCVAVASSSGWTSAKAMMTYGFLAMFIGVVVATFIGYPLALLFA